MDLSHYNPFGDLGCIPPYLQGCHDFGITEALILAGASAAASAGGAMIANRGASARAQEANWTGYQMQKDDQAFEAAEAQKAREENRYQQQWSMDYNSAEAQKARDFTWQGLLENQQYSAQQSGIQRDWQERLANTAHQREVADLRAAGLNPVLSGLGGSGAATPSGGLMAASAPTSATASTHPMASSAAHAGMAQSKMAPVSDVIGPGLSSAMQALNTITGFQRAQADIGKTNAETSNLAATAKNIEADTALKGATTASATKQLDVQDRDIERLRSLTKSLDAEPGLKAALATQALRAADASTQSVATGKTAADLNQAQTEQIKRLMNLPSEGGILGISPKAVVSTLDTLIKRFSGNSATSGIPPAQFNVNPRTGLLEGSR